MKKLLFIITTIFMTTFFTACSSKSQNDVLNSSKQDVSDLLSQLIEKEKEINKLTKQLEECKQKTK